MGEFEDILKEKMHVYVKLIYRITKTFPKEEIYGLTSQIRRSSLSVILNYIEGYARFRKKDKLRFYEIAYASLKESKYLVYFSYSESLISENEYKKRIAYAEEIGRMLWKLMKPLRSF